MSNMKVLVVEDEAPLMNAIMAKMKKSELSAVGVNSVAEARQKIDESKPDLIWLDHYLFGAEDGLDLLKELKSNEETKEIPVFVVSNTCTNEKYHDYMELGIEKYFIKSSSKLEDIISEAKKYIIQ